VRASNVPLGFYEAVLARDPQGRKQLYGWRYVGFQPFNGCPLAAGGQEPACCNDFETYGLVFDNGIMTFKRLGVVRGLDQAYNYEYEPVTEPADIPSRTMEPLPADWTTPLPEPLEG
jgi:hypothetical protein